jgi:hypothetical protein
MAVAAALDELIQYSLLVPTISAATLAPWPSTMRTSSPRCSNAPVSRAM